MLYFLVLILFSCSENEQEESFNHMQFYLQNSKEIPARTYLALGDSYTVGQGVDLTETWPSQMVDKLKAVDILYEDPKVIAKTGWTTDELALAMTQELSTETFDLVTLLIGVNNQFRGRAAAQFRVEFMNLLERAIVLANNTPTQVIVLSIPDWGVSPYGANFDRAKISAEIDQFNSIKKEETLKRNAHFVDVTVLSRQALNNDEFIAGDGLHFSGEMYELWADEVIKKVF